MEIKKSNKVDLESRKGTWFSMGLMIVLAFMFIAFEWTEYDKKYETASLANDPTFELTLLPVTYPEPPKPPPPAPAVVEELHIVEGTEEVDDIYMESPEDLGQVVDIKYVPILIEEEEEKVDETEIFAIAEKMPEFPGGTAALFEYLNKSIKYPTVAIETGTQGKVITQFVVDKDGSISDIQVVRSVDPYLDKEAIRVIRAMPKWSPGMQRNKAVRVKYTVPVVFRLQ
ncbi:energy transducer TonB [Bacteroides sp. 519]|uniref:energy transducer TonB n=1 Tax=Bacteroides sp. 519 TaxID=2302937 RepID=UPI0013CFDE8B|nr:energy transducer TonB [Bacteroides sp. 519]NDV57582.1 energy transducer TonB [Bacteroides sp. 519]